MLHDGQRKGLRKALGISESSTALATAYVASLATLAGPLPPSLGERAASEDPAGARAVIRAAARASNFPAELGDQPADSLLEIVASWLLARRGCLPPSRRNPEPPVAHEGDRVAIRGRARSATISVEQAVKGVQEAERRVRTLEGKLKGELDELRKELGIDRGSRSHQPRQEQQKSSTESWRGCLGQVVVEEVCPQASQQLQAAYREVKSTFREGENLAQELVALYQDIPETRAEELQRIATKAISDIPSLQQLQAEELRRLRRSKEAHSDVPVAQPSVEHHSEAPQSDGLSVSDFAKAAAGARLACQDRIQSEVEALKKAFGGDANALVKLSR